MSVVTVIAIAILCIATFLLKILTSCKSVHCLPGPKGIPWLGPIYQIPRFGTFLKFNEWAQQYGPVITVQILGRTHVILSTQKVAASLLGSRGAIYSGRPAIPTLNDSQSVLGTAEYLPLMAKNEFHSRHKKLNHVNVTFASRKDYYNYPAIEAKRLVYRMMNDCSLWSSLMEDMTSRVICRLCWGTPDLAEALRPDSWNLLIHISPAGFLTNLLTPLMLLPHWISPWKRAEKVRHDSQKAFFLENMADVERKMATKSAGPSYTRAYLESPQAIESPAEAAFAIGMLAVTAIFTVSSPMQTFIRAAVLYPDWLRRVQDELDEVCGSHRMPEVADTPRLPVLRAFIKECLRWRPPIPGGIPHELEADDVFQGCRLAKGTVIHPLEFAITHDPELYPEPYCFNPARWLDPSFPTTYREPLTKHPSILGFSCFGWGRRYCQGQELTQQELVVACGSIAWAFNLGIPEGNPMPSADMEVPGKWDESLILVRPPPFEIECVIREGRKEVVESSYHESKSGLVDCLRLVGAVTVD